MNESWLLVEEIESFGFPHGVRLPAFLDLLELSCVVLLEFGNTQAVLVWDFGLKDDL